MSVNSTSPATLFGGTWERIQDMFLYAGKDGDTTYGPGKTGGSKTTSYTPGGSIGGTAITKAQLPSYTLYSASHSHNYAIKSSSTDNTGSFTAPSAVVQAVSARNTATSSTTITVTSGGSGQTHNHAFTGSAASLANMPPYLAVYMWKRTA